MGVIAGRYDNDSLRSVSLMLVNVVLTHMHLQFPPTACKHLPLNGPGSGHLSSEAAPKDPQEAGLDQVIALHALDQCFTHSPCDIIRTVPTYTAHNAPLGLH